MTISPRSLRRRILVAGLAVTLTAGGTACSSKSASNAAKVETKSTTTVEGSAKKATDKSAADKAKTRGADEPSVTVRLGDLSGSTSGSGSAGAATGTGSGGSKGSSGSTGSTGSSGAGRSSSTGTSGSGGGSSTGSGSGSGRSGSTGTTPAPSGGGSGTGSEATGSPSTDHDPVTTPATPVINSFVVQSEVSCLAGTVMIPVSWNVGDAEYVTVKVDRRVLVNSMNRYGTIEAPFECGSDHVYQLSVTGPGGVSVKSKTVVYKAKTVPVPRGRVDVPSTSTLPTPPTPRL